MLSELLASNKEEPIQKYLEINSKILIATFGMPEWYYKIVIPKFRFGSDYCSDFVIINGQSYSYWIYLIELEPATEKLFTKNGDYARRLNHAIKQVDEWGDWIKRNENYFLIQDYVEIPDNGFLNILSHLLEQTNKMVILV